MFNSISFAWPQQLSHIVDSVTSNLGAAASQLVMAQGRLNAAPDYNMVNNPVGASCTGSIAEFGLLVDSMLAGLRVLCVHPWAQGVGEGNDHYRYLSTANAVVTAAKKLVDSNDHHAPNRTIDALVMLITANGYFGFYETLKQFNAVFPLPETLMCERRAAQLATVELDKIILPEAPINSRWREFESAHCAGVKFAAEVTGALSAHAEAYEVGALSPEQELIDLIIKKNNTLTDTQNRVAEIAARCSGDAGAGKFFANTSPSQIKDLLEFSGAGHDAPLCCCLIFTSAPGELELLREFVGL